MALSLYVFHFFNKFKVLLLVTLCLMVLWAAFSYFVDSGQTIPKLKSVGVHFGKIISLEEEEDSQTEEKMKLTEVPATKPPQGPCPALSPYLRGASKLTFSPALTLEEVQKENPQVAEGRYHPAECSALQRVAILIPHRNRERHLLYLLEHLHPFLQRQQLDYGIYVIHQAGSTKFNRAKLLNVGYLEALKEENWDCFIFHDVDLVPENDFNIYMCDRQPKHLVVGRNSTGYRLRYQGYFGGVTALTRDQFSKVNGFSNNYWGWGGEDDDLRIRVEMQKMRVMRPSADVARYTMIFHNRDHGNEENRERMKLLRQVSRTWKTDGLNSCSYRLLSVEHNPLYINITVDFSVQPKTSKG
ncbi:beta-1,4-galactosyltransferase 4 [Meleagris gallopavo]|uniref:Beta-1,4-galactosyltransferase n=2 Tax=Meleagris gallopavo TaxID=9103 RepID=A0A803Y346_MELGA|nr:beta-1,4-galactosyltransferase 4 [Meleagris gallopavo]XP_010717510.1 beta-1,4-galactosyltransferase 4 [Meleagris gallopavo]XP_010717517.1 beta-1,4-galactosyltransferase 4 [Meleagris gallopavo]XP_010717525.1 beta-1,4-galactosyltransferase 4 [Meleagris gallopavo]XP_010717528.1 beta-1,4-galactosyltransferase 4 [Meleagris gallopavo]XP_010717535.1 beta-1,4-galactosyltransferase 4 [Meleagris gallopavo]XP_010717542.1 beta-1,4-galactosyltransferase 4 [Meleagris gallopavo]XP_010717548.1 beta-1,4-g